MNTFKLTLHTEPMPHAWDAVAMLAASAAEQATIAAERANAIDAMRETVATCERLLAQARAVMLGEVELDEAGFAELLAEMTAPRISIAARPSSHSATSSAACVGR